MRRNTRSIKGYLYISIQQKSFITEAVHLMLLGARKNNLKFGITGCLFNYRGYFVQYFEGAPAKVDILYEYILKDKRHSKMTLLWSNTHQNRLFPNFQMDFHDLNGSTDVLQTRIQVLQDFLSRAEIAPDNKNIFQALLRTTNLLLQQDQDPFQQLHTISTSQNFLGTDHLSTKR